MARDMLEVTIRGDREVERALGKLGDGAERDLRAFADDIAVRLAAKVRAGANDAQSRRAASTVRAQVGTGWPSVTAGPHPLLFGSEFGMTRRSGWYAAGRYWDSVGRQFRPHLGRGSYWFFATQDANRGWVDDEWAAALDLVTNEWSA